MKNSPLKGPFQQTFYTTTPTENISLERIWKTRQIQKIKTTWWLLLITKLMSRSYRWATVSIYRHIVSSLVLMGSVWWFNHIWFSPHSSNVTLILYVQLALFWETLSGMSFKILYDWCKSESSLLCKIFDQYFINIIFLWMLIGSRPSSPFNASILVDFLKSPEHGFGINMRKNLN